MAELYLLFWSERPTYIYISSSFKRRSNTVKIMTIHFPKVFPKGVSNDCSLCTNGHQNTLEKRMSRWLINGRTNEWYLKPTNGGLVKLFLFLKLHQQVCRNSILFVLYQELTKCQAWWFTTDVTSTRSFGLLVNHLNLIGFFLFDRLFKCQTNGKECKMCLGNVSSHGICSRWDAVMLW